MCTRFVRPLPDRVHSEVISVDGAGRSPRRPTTDLRALMTRPALLRSSAPRLVADPPAVCPTLPEKSPSDCRAGRRHSCRILPLNAARQLSPLHHRRIGGRCERHNPQIESVVISHPRLSVAVHTFKFPMKIRRRWSTRVPNFHPCPFERVSKRVSTSRPGSERLETCSRPIWIWSAPSARHLAMQPLAASASIRPPFATAVDGYSIQRHDPLTPEPFPANLDRVWR